jgi:hypothetical protein
MKANSNLSRATRNTEFQKKTIQCPLYYFNISSKKERKRKKKQKYNNKKETKTEARY